MSVVCKRIVCVNVGKNYVRPCDCFSRCLQDNVNRQEREVDGLSTIEMFSNFWDICKLTCKNILVLDVWIIFKSVPQC